MIMKNNRGMTLIEALIGNALLIIVIFSSLSVFKDVVGAHVGSESYLNLIVTRNRLISHILDTRTWEHTVTATENTALSCLKNLDNPDATTRDCKSVVNQKINLYSLDEEVAFPTKDATIGIGKAGPICNSFNAASGSGDANCPLGIDLTMTALCEAGSPTCYNPPMLFQAQFILNGDSTTPNINTQPFNFSVINTGSYCPTQNPAVGLVGDAEITATSTSVTGMTVASQVGHYAQSDPMFPCRQSIVSFTINSSNYSNVAGNQTTVCLADEGLGTCGFSFVHKRSPAGVLSYDLVQNGVTVATKPTWMNMSGSESYELEVFNGMVKFCVDLRCLYFFENKLEGPFRVRVYPAWSNGVLPILDNFDTSFEDL